MSSIHDHRYFMGIRYIDDLRLIVLANKKSSESIQNSHNLIKSFIKNLPDSLILEAEPNENNSFRFLEAYLSFSDRELKMAYISKNFHYGTLFPAVLDTYPFQSYTNSYMENPDQEIRNNIRNRLEAVENYSINEYSIFIAMVSTLGDFYCSNFPRPIVLSSLYSYIQNKTPRKNKWETTYKLNYDNYPQNS